MQQRYIFYSMLFFFSTVHNFSYAMEEEHKQLIEEREKFTDTILFSPGHSKLGKVQDTKTLLQLKTMAARSFENLTQNGGISVSDNVSRALEAVPEESSEDDSIYVEKKDLTELVKLVIKDGGTIKRWNTGFETQGTEIHVRLIRQKKFIYIQGPILDAVKEAGLIKEEKRCIIN